MAGFRLMDWDKSENAPADGKMKENITRRLTWKNAKRARYVSAIAAPTLAVGIVVGLFRFRSPSRFGISALRPSERQKQTEAAQQEAD